MILFLLVLIFIGLGIFLTWFLLSHDHGEKEPVGALWIALAFGVLGAVAAGILELWLIPDKYSTGAAGSANGPLFLGTMGIGIIEETCKFLPLALFLYPKRYFNEHTDGIIYFAIAGLGFGVPENILYTLQFGSSAGWTRLVLTPFFHAATTSLVGYYLARAKVEHKRLLPVGLALIGAAVLHGLYDFGAFSAVTIYTVMAFMITLGVTVMMFVLFMRAGERDQAQGLSAVGKNAFCRSCGFPNPNHNLYCEHCGKRA